MAEPIFPPEPEKTCALCPRLVDLRQTYALEEPGWYNGAVPSFGDEHASLLIVGLAPGLRGANRTGRTFTGDASGALLYSTLTKLGLSNGTRCEDAQDDYTLQNVMVTNAVRCVPPQNKPSSIEINTCRPYLKARILALRNLKTILMLGRIAHASTLRALAIKPKAFPFAHSGEYKTELEGRALRLISSYHCSRYNVNTRRLTPDMFEAVLRRAKHSLA